MRVVVCNELGPVEKLTLASRPSPTPRANEVRIEVRASGVNFVDALFVGGQYQIRPEPPFVPGSEVAGHVVEVGSEVSRFAPGDRVIAMTALGGFAEEACARESNTMRLPEAIDFARGAGIIQSYATALYALEQRADLKAEERVLVLGAAGGVGLAAIDIASGTGARVIAAASSEAKREQALRAGAQEVFDYTNEDIKTRCREWSDGGVDVVFDPVGGPYSEPALRALRWGGRFLVIGFASGEIARIPMNLALLNRRSILGVDWGAFTVRDPAGHRNLLADLESQLLEGRLSPVEPQCYALERAAEALADLSARRVVGKAVLLPPAAA